MVNGAPYPGGSTNLAAGTQVAVTGGALTVTAGDSDVVDLCADWSAGAESGTLCFDTTITRFPPDEVVSLIEDLPRLLDPTICPVLSSLAPGIPGIIDIDPEGDFTSLGTLYHDCPPYGS